MVDPGEEAADAIGWGRSADGIVDAGAAAIAGLLLGGISLLFLAGSQFVIGAYGLRGSYDPRDPLTITSIGQLVVALLGLGLARYGQRRADNGWQRSVAGAGVLTATISACISISAVVFILTR